MLMAATRGEDALSEICLPGLDHRIWPPGADADASSVVHSIGIANEAGRLLFKLEKKHGYFSSIEYRKV